MTSISNYFLIQTPCCRTLYAAPEYSSINLGAREYWSDGHREAALFIEDGGLSKCACGEFYLLRDALRLEEKSEPDTQIVEPLEAADFPVAVQSCSKPIELQARRMYWRYLNHDYRNVHRTRIATSVQSKNRSRAGMRLLLLCAKLVGRTFRITRSNAFMPDAMPINQAPFKLSADQKLNMMRLLELIQDGGHDVQHPDLVEVAELYRELGLFEQARGAINCSSPDRTRLPIKLIADMIDREEQAPFLYNF
jgi:hypothetical protein